MDNVFEKLVSGIRWWRFLFIQVIQIWYFGTKSGQLDFLYFSGGQFSARNPARQSWGSDLDESRNCPPLKYSKSSWPDLVSKYHCVWNITPKRRFSAWLARGKEGIDKFACLQLNLKPKYSFGKWWKLKFSIMGIVHKSCMSSQSPVNLFVRNHQFS